MHQNGQIMTPNCHLPKNATSHEVFFASFAVSSSGFIDSVRALLIDCKFHRWLILMSDGPTLSWEERWMERARKLIMWTMKAAASVAIPRHTSFHSRSACRAQDIFISLYRRQFFSSAPTVVVANSFYSHFLLNFAWPLGIRSIQKFRRSKCTAHASAMFAVNNVLIVFCSLISLDGVRRETVSPNAIFILLLFALFFPFRRSCCRCCRCDSVRKSDTFLHSRIAATLKYGHKT